MCVCVMRVICVRCVMSVICVCVMSDMCDIV
jgi:hypothetical protein